MKRDYFALWSLLAVAFVLFFGLSTCTEEELPLGIKPSKMAESVFGPRQPVIAQTDTLTVAETDTIPVQRTILGDKPMTFLFIGDSMLEGLSPRLGAYCQANGHSLYTVIWYSAQSERYAKSKLITHYIEKYHPDYIFLSLGGNELFVNDIASKRDKYVKEIVAEIGDIPYLWVGPPNWKPDTGINDLIKANVPEGCYFRSAEMHFDRKRDGAHPTSASAAMWMDSIIRWMPEHAHYPIKFEPPTQQSWRGNKLLLHQPGESPF